MRWVSNAAVVERLGLTTLHVLSHVLVGATGEVDEAGESSFHLRMPCIFRDETCRKRVLGAAERRRTGPAFVACHPVLEDAGGWPCELPNGRADATGGFAKEIVSLVLLLY